jgi:hypothetical protein
MFLLRNSGCENSCVFQGKITLYRIKHAYEQIAVMGIVMTHAVTIRRTVPHWTAEDPRVAPTPIMAPVIAWVVETGTPNAVMNVRMCYQRTIEVYNNRLHTLVVDMELRKVQFTGGSSYILTQDFKGSEA